MTVTYSLNTTDVTKIKIIFLHISAITRRLNIQVYFLKEKAVSKIFNYLKK